MCQISGSWQNYWPDIRPNHYPVQPYYLIKLWGVFVFEGSPPNYPASDPQKRGFRVDIIFWPETRKRTLYTPEKKKKIINLVQSIGLGQADHGQNSACAVESRDTAVLIQPSLEINTAFMNKHAHGRQKQWCCQTPI